MALSDLFCHVVDGEILKVNIRRGGVFNDKQLGKNSSDSKYLELGLYPVSGGKPAYNAHSQVCSGPVFEFDELSEVVNRVYTVSDIPISALQSQAKQKINQIRYNRSTTDIPHTSSTGTFNYFHSSEAIAEFKQVVNEVTNPLIPLNYMQGTGGYWRSNDDVNVPLTETEFLDLSITVTMWAAGIIRESHSAKSLIDLATTKQEIDTIVSNFETLNPLST